MERNLVLDIIHTIYESRALCVMCLGERLDS
jgi:hypothetical protein